MKKKVKHTKLENIESVPNASTSSCVSGENTPNAQQNVSTTDESTTAATHTVNEVAHQQLEQIFWSKSTNEEEKTREEEFDEYLADLLL